MVLVFSGKGIFPAFPVFSRSLLKFWKILPTKASAASFPSVWICFVLKMIIPVFFPRGMVDKHLRYVFMESTKCCVFVYSEQFWKSLFETVSNVTDASTQLERIRSVACAFDLISVEMNRHPTESALFGEQMVEDYWIPYVKNVLRKIFLVRQFHLAATVHVSWKTKTVNVCLTSDTVGH